MQLVSILHTIDAIDMENTLTTSSKSLMRTENQVQLVCSSSPNLTVMRIVTMATMVGKGPERTSISMIPQGITQQTDYLPLSKEAKGFCSP